MGKSRTFRYQVGGKYHRIKDTMYHVVASGSKDFATKKAKSFDYAIIKKDLGSYAVLVPVAPSFSAKDLLSPEQIRKYSANWKKLKKVM